MDSSRKMEASGACANRRREAAASFRCLPFPGSFECLSRALSLCKYRGRDQETVIYLLEQTKKHLEGREAVGWGAAQRMIIMASPKSSRLPRKRKKKKKKIEIASLHLPSSSSSSLVLAPSHASPLSPRPPLSCTCPRPTKKLTRFPKNQLEPKKISSQGNRTTPSYVAFTDTERLIGDAAKSQVAMNPINTVFDAKRLIGRKFNDATIQADIKHWPFKVKPGVGDKPMIEGEFLFLLMLPGFLFCPFFCSRVRLRCRILLPSASLGASIAMCYAPWESRRENRRRGRELAAAMFHERSLAFSEAFSSSLFFASSLFFFFFLLPSLSLSPPPFNNPPTSIPPQQLSPQSNTRTRPRSSPPRRSPRWSSSR